MKPPWREPSSTIRYTAMRAAGKRVTSKVERGGPGVLSDNGERGSVPERVWTLLCPCGMRDDDDETRKSATAFRIFTPHQHMRTSHTRACGSHVQAGLAAEHCESTVGDECMAFMQVIGENAGTARLCARHAMIQWAEKGEGEWGGRGAGETRDPTRAAPYTYKSNWP